MHIQTDIFLMWTKGAIYTQSKWYWCSHVRTHMHTVQIHVHVHSTHSAHAQNAEYQRGQSLRQKCNRERERELWENGESWDCDWALVIFGSISTLCSLDGESSHEPLDRLTEPETHRRAERGSVKERERRSPTHSSPKEPARLLRQLKWDDPPPYPLKYPSTPSVLSAGPVKASLHSLTCTDTP